MVGHRLSLPDDDDDDESVYVHLQQPIAHRHDNGDGSGDGSGRRQPSRPTRGSVSNISSRPCYPYSLRTSQRESSREHSGLGRHERACPPPQPPVPHPAPSGVVLGDKVTDNNHDRTGNVESANRCERGALPWLQRLSSSGRRDDGEGGRRLGLDAAVHRTDPIRRRRQINTERAREGGGGGKELNGKRNEEEGCVRPRSKLS